MDPTKTHCISISASHRNTKFQPLTFPMPPNGRNRRVEGDTVRSRHDQSAVIRFGLPPHYRAEQM